MTVHWIDFSKVGKNNPLNPIGAALRSFILEELKFACNSNVITSVVLFGGQHHFSAGADLSEFANAKPEDIAASFTTTLIEVCNALENFPKPVLAAVHGRALGGGMEIALACHYRICSVNSIWALPEVKVGLIPGAGGTQRLPRLIGTRAALDLILTGNSILGKQAHDLGIVDATVEACTTPTVLMQSAQKWATWAALMPVDSRRVGCLPTKETPAQAKALCQAAAKKMPARDVGGEAVQSALEAVQACTTSQSLEEGLEVEEELVMNCLMSPQGSARRHVFFAIRQAQKPLYHATLATNPVHPLLRNTSTCLVGVIGAGTMGAGIAVVLLQAGYPKVYLVDINPKALAKGVAFVQKAIQSLVKRKKIKPLQAEAFEKALVATTKLEDLKDAQLVVEAVVENMKIKESIFRTLDMVTSSNCILLSNTSTLSIDQMAAAMSPSRRASFAGWHFFSPANIMPLVEIVVGKDTAPEAVSLLQSLTKKIGKIGVVVGNCDGFCGNRMVRPYGGESVLLLAEGVASVAQVDSALNASNFGMAMGPLAMSDLAGNDIGYNIRREKGWIRDPKTGSNGSERPARYTELADDLVAKLGRLGQKAGKGWFDYNPEIGRGQKPFPSKEVQAFIPHYVRQHRQGLSQAPQALSTSQIIERVLFPLVNEGFKCLEDNIAQKPSDIDVIYIFGYGWPAWRGGPMFWADNEVGLDHLLEGLRLFSTQFPDAEHYVPSKLLEECVRLNSTVGDYYKKGLHKKRGKSKL